MLEKNLSRLVEDYISFQKYSPSPFHVVQTLEDLFSKHGYKNCGRIPEKKLKPGDRFFIVHQDGKSMLTFVTGRRSPAEAGFSIAGAHTDSPALRLRMNPWSQEKGLIRLETQCHGGLIARTWLDRPLKIAGAVYSLQRGSDGSVDFSQMENLPGLKKKTVATSRPVAVIPDIAIHLDSKKNSSGEINLETMLSAFLSSDSDPASCKENFWKALGCPAEEADGFELCLAPYEDHRITGLDQSYITGPRHDDLAMVFSIAQAQSGLEPDFIPERTCVGAFFDAEETGSVTSSGAASSFLRDSLLAVSDACDKPAEGSSRESCLSKSFLISADMAHAWHPAHPQKFDKNHNLTVNGGMVIKENSNDRYATSGASGTIFRGLCEAAGVPVQAYINRQDIGCGSTIGPALAASLSCLTVDVGTAMWAMHSTGETMGTKDLGYARDLFTTYFKGRTQ